MSRADDWRGRWTDQSQRIGATKAVPVAAGAGLGLLALIESIERAGSVAQAIDHQLNWPFVLALGVLGLAGTLPVMLRPAVAAGMVSAASVASLTAFGVLTLAGLAAQLIVVYRLGRHGPPLLAVLLAAAFPVLALADQTAGETRIVTVLVASLVPAAAMGGIARRARSEAQTHSAAEQVIAGSLLEHAARGERARIARELHDVVAHHISMVVVQAESARLTTPGLPAAGAQRLSAIGDTARDALTEMRRLLGVLREDARADPAERQPQPGLRQLNELLDAARDASGTAARLILRGPPAALDPGVELAAYRIVQEALTNARRHAPGAAVDVELSYTDNTLWLRIRDNGPGPPDDVPARPRRAGQAGVPGGDQADGHGLPGMRERAAAVGGELATGPAAGGGFLVEARMPVKTETAA